MLEKCLLGIGKSQFLINGMGLLLGSWMSIGALADAVTVKSVTVDARLMQFPAISLDGINYESLVFEYAQQGSVDIVEMRDAVETLQCNGQLRDHNYLVVEYRGPEVVFRVKDMAKNRVLLLKPIETKGTYDFARGECNSSADLRAEFEIDLLAWQATKKQQLLAGARKEMEEFMQTSSALNYRDLRFPLHFFSGESSKYDDLNRTFDLARESFDISVQYGITQETEFGLQKAAKAWEDALIELGSDVNLDKDKSAVKLALHRNLIPVYVFLRKYEQARRHDAVALSLGMDKTSSMQELILANERRTILSPKVSSNLVLTANLYRFGQNAMRDKRLVEHTSITDLKQAVTQR
jgi:hypothetical protein